mmetsp:Transcript_20645/g.19639  ORF Transcript_20645/g.19639 Transcript_20645/m.19639 type:complete len:88 (-) Transcript_20645:1911-2174(-)
MVQKYYEGCKIKVITLLDSIKEKADCDSNGSSDPNSALKENSGSKSGEGELREKEQLFFNCDDDEDELGEPIVEEMKEETLNPWSSP